MQVSVADHELCSTSRESGNSESPSYCIPERSVNEKAIAILVFVVGFAYLFLFRRYTGMEPDEGIILLARCCTGTSSHSLLRAHTTFWH